MTGHPGAAQTVEAKCREIYREAEVIFSQLPRSRYYGFKILYGPPLFRPPILFIGYQPGGGSADFERETARGTDKQWPPTCDYATQDWAIARKMRGLFGREFLAGCTGTNAIYLRSPSIRDYRRDHDRDTRSKVERFCLAQTAQIVEVINPQKIVVIGFGTLGLFGPSNVGAKNANGRALIRIGKVAGRPAIATLHLSGAHISRSDLEIIGSAIQDEVRVKTLIDRFSERF